MPKRSEYDKLVSGESEYQVAMALGTYEVWYRGVCLSEHPTRPQANAAVKRYQEADARRAKQ